MNERSTSIEQKTNGLFMQMKTLDVTLLLQTWFADKEVLQQLAQYGIEHIETIRVAEDIKNNRKTKEGDTKNKNKIKGFAFLEFSTHSKAQQQHFNV
ncbi:nucleotide-binding alpha-beta plait domain-containing protein [Tanacetum coccineum]